MYAEKAMALTYVLLPAGKSHGWKKHSELTALGSAMKEWDSD